MHKERTFPLFNPYSHLIAFGHFQFCPINRMKKMFYSSCKILTSWCCLPCWLNMDSLCNPFVCLLPVEDWAAFVRICAGNNPDLTGYPSLLAILRIFFFEIYVLLNFCLRSVFWVAFHFLVGFLWLHKCLPNHIGQIPLTFFLFVLSLTFQLLDMFGAQKNISQ